jgi:hypothetical protein
MWSVYLSPADKAYGRQAVADIRAARTATARELRAARANWRKRARQHSTLVMGVDCWNLLPSHSRRSRYLNPDNARGYRAAWNTVRGYETCGVDLAGLPCGADDHAYELAVERYAAALAIVVEAGGRPLP